MPVFAVFLSTLVLTTNHINRRLYSTSRCNDPLEREALRLRVSAIIL